VPCSVCATDAGWCDVPWLARSCWRAGRKTNVLRR